MKESEIRPKNLHDTIIDLSRQDVERLILSKKDELEEIVCPACGSKNLTFQFKKFGLDYVLCDDCRSLFLSPRPTESFLNKIYPEMESVKYWETHFYKETAEPRREKMYNPRAKKVVELADKYSVLDKDLLIDVGAGYGVFLEEIKKVSNFKELVAIEPVSSLAEVCKSRGIKVIEKNAQDATSEDIPEKAAVLTCFEVLEHLINPLTFLNSLSKLLKKEGLFILSAPCISGIDVQILWEKSKTIYPPHHINLLSIEGMESLAKRTNDLEIVEISTPGKLDVDIIRNAKKEGLVDNLGRFFDYFFWRENEEAFSGLQQFCQKYNLSSHLMVVMKKK
ncbi:MAG: class I SAM-dependent methyltransferase [Candidatus Nealsonbacteria bacterium]